MVKRVFDIICSLIGLLILFIPFVFISIWVMIDSRGGVFYSQTRVGKDGKDFSLFKFRSMHTNADKQGLLTVGGRDARITGAGYFIRKYKIDELPQLFNVLIGNMSLVGPRPEVRKYVDLYTPEQLKVLSVKPGITDMASIVFRNENDILAKADDSEKAYIEQVLPAKLKLNLKYIEEQSFGNDLKLIFGTIVRILKK